MGAFCHMILGKHPSLVASVCLLCLSVAPGCASLAALDRQANAPLPSVNGIAHPATPEPFTLPRFLGLDVAARRTVLLGQVVREKVAVVVPALEPKPLSLPASHPANADSPSPAVAAAHKSKKAKAAAAAKVKAIGSLDGGDCAADPVVEEAVLAALDDISVDVRIAALKAILGSTGGCEPGCAGACTDAIRSKLTKIAFEKHGPRQWGEPSSKARRLARLSLDACGGPLCTEDCQCDPVELAPSETPSPEVIQEILLVP